MSLSDTAARRLCHYCWRVPISPPEYVQCGRWRPRTLNRHIRELIWTDTEVRETLLHDDYDELGAQVPADQALNLLDVVTATHLEAKMRSEASPMPGAA
jgi:hypothetical protein